MATQFGSQSSWVSGHVKIDSIHASEYFPTPLALGICFREVRTVYMCSINSALGYGYKMVLFSRYEVT